MIHNPTIIKRTVACLLAAIVAAAIAPWASATPVVPSSETHTDGTPFVTLDKQEVSVPSDGTLSLNVAVRIDGPTSYLESRLQLRRPDGRLLYQKTEIRHEVPTGTATIPYSRTLDDLTLDAGIYPLEIRVRSDSQGEVREWNIADELLVYDPNAEPTELIVVVRTAGAPQTDPEGRFVTDPARNSRVRDQVEALSGLLLAQQSLNIGIALPPVLAEEWLSASQGYEVLGSDGVISVDAEHPDAQAHATTISLLRTALESDRMELMDVPYADPDPSGLLQTDREGDLLPQYERGTSAYLAALETTPSASTMLAGGALTEMLASVMRARGKTIVLVDPTSLEDTSALHADLGQGLRALAIDTSASNALRSGEATTFARVVFEHHLSEETSTPVVVVADLAAGDGLTVAAIEELLLPIAQSDWIDNIAPANASIPMSDGSALAVKPASPQLTGPPSDYWETVAQSRISAEALLAALGSEDAAANDAQDSSLIAQSALWAGRDGNWSLLDRGRTHATFASRQTAAILGGIRLTVNDVTLSSAQGEIPISIMNPTDRQIVVVMHQIADGLVLPDSGDVTIELSPAENYLTLPVDLQSSLSGKVNLELWAGDLLLDEASVVVRASYLDRLVIVGAIAIILVVLLIFIKRRVKTTEVDIIDDKLDDSLEGGEADS